MKKGLQHLPRVVLFFVFTFLIISSPAYAQCLSGVEGPFGCPSCTDLIDNDGDGKKDSADRDCYNIIGDPAVDDDGDGMTENAGDCNDANTAIYTGATKICDGKDNNCDGIRDFSTDIDADKDGAPKCTPTGGVKDCDDNDALESPFLIEGPPGDPTCADLRDNDCDGKINLADPGCVNSCLDDDGDGYYSINSDVSCTQPKDDCDDSDPAIHPGASETTCNGVDNDCDLAIDEDYVETATTCGVGACGSAGVLQCISGVLNDTCVPGSPSPELWAPGPNTICTDTIDNDCDGLTDIADSGCAPCVATGTPESVCNNVDDNCDGAVDEDYVAPVTNCGVGDCSTTGLDECINGVVIDSCIPLSPGTEGPTGDPTCSPLTGDEDCDGLLNSDDPDCGAPCRDDDSDGYAVCDGICDATGLICGDCDDTDSAVYPGAPKICDGKDNNCDGIRDFSTDIDGDNDGAPKCTPPSGLKDCDDSDPNESPFLTEGPPGDTTCTDLLDNDCDGKINLADPGCVDPCLDDDGDGFYSVTSDVSCTLPRDDCDDNNAAIHPGASESACNGIDDDCDLAIDEDYIEAATTCGVGACASAGVLQCISGALNNTCVPGSPSPELWAPGPNTICTDTIDNDCDGFTDIADSGCAPCVDTGIGEAVCNGADDDCDGLIDEDYIAPVTNCGVGDCETTGLDECIDGVVVDSCVPLPAGTEGPVGTPTCDPLSGDEDCDGLLNDLDPDCGAACPDSDGDGFAVCDGICDETGLICGDCDDTDSAVHPGAAKICDGKDNNCDGIRDFSTDTDNDHDGVPRCTTPSGLKDCDDNDPLASPLLTEGPTGDPTCSDIRDNDCDGNADQADNACFPPSCNTRLSPKIGPHTEDLMLRGLDPDDPSDDTVHPDNNTMLCQKCHGTSLADPVRYQCERCHSEGGSTKAAYPDVWPYGFGSATNARTHLHDAAAPVTPPGCVTCHNPHLQEQDLKYETTYGKYIKTFICYDDTRNLVRFEDFVQLTAPEGDGSFADGPPHNENICEICHTQTRHHRRDGQAPEDFNRNGVYVGHFDDQNCTDCHLHADGFLPTGATGQSPHNTQLFNENCQFCHVETDGVIDFRAVVPDTLCQQCHAERDGHTSDPARNEFATGSYTYDIQCVDCHDPMFPVANNNRKLLRAELAASVDPFSDVVNTTRKGAGSFADGPPHEDNICETCHFQTLHNRYDGAGGSLHLDGIDYTGSNCMLCHDHDRSFMAPGKTCLEENEPGISCIP